MSVFDFNVCEPVKIERGGMKLAYWKYRVNTKTTCTQYARKEYGTYRRYSDFAWLRKRLVETYPGCLVPPLPEKDVKENFDKLFGGSGEETSLHRFRQRALRKFLVRVGAHPKLALSGSLQEFIELDEDEFAKRMKQVSKPDSILKSTSQFKQMSLSVTNRLSSDLNAISLKATPFKDEYPPEKQKWHDVQQYLNKLENALCMMRDRFDNLARKKRSFAGSMHDTGKAFATIFEKDAQFTGANYGEGVSRAEAVSRLEEEAAEADVTQIIETLTYYAGLCRAAEGVVDYLKSLWILEAVLEKDLDTLRKKREKGGTKEQTDSADASVTGSMAKNDEVTGHIRLVIETFSDDLKRFELEKQHDLKSLLSMNVDLTKEFALKRQEAWDALATTTSM